MRGELWEAIDALHTIRTRALVPLITWGAGAPAEGSRRLEQKADGEVLAHLAGTLAPPESPALYAALQESVALYGALRDPLFARFGLETSRDAERALGAALAQHWAACAQAPR